MTEECTDDCHGNCDMLRDGELVTHRNSDIQYNNFSSTLLVRSVKLVLDLSEMINRISRAP